MCWLTDPEMSISEDRAGTGASATTANGRSRKIWTGLHLAHQPGNRLRDSIRTHVLRLDRNWSAILMRVSKVPNVLRTSSGRAARDGADVFAEAIRLTMYHRNLTLYEIFDVI
jgi:hypothetical protein